MKRQLIFIHGRSQEHKDADALKREWVDTWKRGLNQLGRSMPIDFSDIRFPYYGQTLYDLVYQGRGTDAADVIIRGAGTGATDAQAKGIATDPIEAEFFTSILDETMKAAGITADDVQRADPAAAQAKGLLNHAWPLAVLRLIDQKVPGGSSASIALATRDVYAYLKNPGVRDTIEKGIRGALAPGVPTVVVAHSLGTVVAFNLLRREAKAAGWIVPRLITVGSPLAVKAVRSSLRPIGFPDGVTEWCNARDRRDLVALHPLDAQRFDVDPAVVNYDEVQNQTSNRHGIVGYLNDPEVARWIDDAVR